MNALALVNGQVVTMEGRNPLAEGVLVRGGRIALVGTSREVLAERGPHTEVIDLKGRALLPGFIDTHVHLISTGLSMMGPRLESCRTLSQVLGALAAEAERQPTIVKASGLEPEAGSNGLHLTRWDLDRIIPFKMAYVVRRDGHSVVVNTRTMEKLALPPNTPGIDGDSTTGESTGILRGDARRIAGERLTSITGNDRQEAIRRATHKAARVGITTVHALDGGWPRGHEDIQTLLSLEPSLPVKIVVYYQTKDVGKARELGLPRIGGCLLVDGSIASHTAALTAPYDDDPDAEGVLYFSNQELRTFIREAHSSGLQISMHAIGDRAIEQLLSVYETVLGEQPRTDHRHRIEHFLMAQPGQVQRAARLGLGVSMQPAFLHFSEERPNLYRERLGEERARQVNPLRQSVEAGILLAGGSDSFVTPMDPLLGVHSAVNDHAPENRLTPQQALEVFTINGARLAFEESEKGSIRPGKAADLVVLGENPLHCPPESIKDIPVEMTIVEGDIKTG